MGSCLIHSHWLPDKYKVSKLSALCGTDNDVRLLFLKSRCLRFDKLENCNDDKLVFVIFNVVIFVKSNFNKFPSRFKSFKESLPLTSIVVIPSPALDIKSDKGKTSNRGKNEKTIDFLHVRMR